MNTNKDKSNFIQRAIADFVDCWITSFISVPIAILLSYLGVKNNFFYYLVWSLVTILYFSLLQSRKAKPYTIGKLIFKLFVLDNNKNVLSTSKLLLRTFIFWLMTFSPLIHFASYIFTVEKHPIVSVSLYAISTSLLLLMYFSILVHPENRGLHDIIADSYIKNKTGGLSEKISEKNASLKPYYIKLSIFFVVVALIFGLISSFPINNETKNKFAEMGVKYIGAGFSQSDYKGKITKTGWVSIGIAPNKMQDKKYQKKLTKLICKEVKAHPDLIDTSAFPFELILDIFDFLSGEKRTQQTLEYDEIGVRFIANIEVGFLNYNLFNTMECP